MSRKSFENYGKRADILKNHTVIAGRYPVQEEAQKNILPDLIKKLDLKSNDIVLEIGCGTGNLLIPVSFLVRSATGIDHASCLKSLRERCDSENIVFISGNFLDLSIDMHFNKILCYSVLHYLQDERKVFSFINKALKLLTPGGWALFGDIPNKSHKDRFVRSKRGKQFAAEWQKMMAGQSVSEGGEEYTVDPDLECVVFNDDLTMKILMHFRRQGYDTYIFPQPPELPFGNTREDILIINSS